MTRSDGGAAWALTRSKILLVAGLAGIGHETVIAPSPRPYLLLLFGAMCGLAGFAKLDELLASRHIRISLDGADRDPPEPLPQPDGGNS